MKMKTIFTFGLFVFAAMIVTTACAPQDNDDHKLGYTPDISELSFTATPTAANTNVIELQNTSSFRHSGGVVYWDLGNGLNAFGDNVVAKYPFANTYTVSMQVYSSGTPVTLTKKVTVTSNDPEQIDSKAVLLAGGLDGNKTWIFDRSHDGHFGVGPVDDSIPSWWPCLAEGKAECSLYDNEFTFNLNGNYNMTWQNKGKIYTNGAGTGRFPGAAISEPPAGDFDVTFIPKENYTFSIKGNVLILSDGAFFGHYAGTSVYTILSLTEDELYLKCASTLEPGNGWWYRFVPKR